MARRIVIAVGTKKGLFVLDGRPSAKRLELRGPVLPGDADEFGADRSAVLRRRDDRSRCRSPTLVRNDGAGEQRPGKEIQTHEIGSTASQQASTSRLFMRSAQLPHISSRRSIEMPGRSLVLGDPVSASSTRMCFR